MVFLNELFSMRSMATISVALILGFVMGLGYSNFQRESGPDIPGDEMLWNRIVINLEQKNVAEAEKWITVLRNDFPESPYCDDAMMVLANNRRNEKKYPKAEQLYTAIKSDYSQGDQFGQSLLQLSDMFLELKKYGEAEAYLAPLEKEFARLPEGGELYHNLVLSQFLQNKYSVAVKTADNFSQRMPESSDLARTKLLQGSIYATYLGNQALAKDIFMGLYNATGISDDIRAEVMIKLKELNIYIGNFDINPELELPVLLPAPLDIITY